MRRVVCGLSALLFSACTGAIFSPLPQPQPPELVSDTEVEAPLPVRRVRRLSAREFDNVVADLLGDTSRPSSLLPFEQYANGYDNGSAQLNVQSEQLASFQAA